MNRGIWLFDLLQTCSCKNTCSRKKTSKSQGCPCKNADLGCCDNCKCGTKKGACKNKTNAVVVNTNPSAFARHQEQQANAEREIKVRGTLTCFFFNSKYLRISLASSHVFCSITKHTFDACFL